MAESNSEKRPSPDEVIPVNWTHLEMVGPQAAVQMGEMTVDEAINLPQYNISSIRRSAVEKFCGPCDNYQKKGGGAD